MINSIIKMLQTSGASTLIMEFSVLGAVLKYILTHNDERNQESHKLYSQLVKKISPMFQDLDSNRNNMVSERERLYKNSFINKMNKKYKLPKIIIKRKIHNNKSFNIILNDYAKRYSYRDALAILESWSSNLSNNWALRRVIKKFYAKNTFIRIFDFHKKLYYNKYSKGCYMNTKKLYKKWKRYIWRRK